MTKIATELFDEWALNNKDFGMQRSHSNAVNRMLRSLTDYRDKSFSFIDAGCGNGWVVRRILEHPLCERAIGIDGAKEMILKAKMINPNGDYIFSDLFDWMPDKQVDFIHSMEVIYYFENPKDIIMYMKNFWLKNGGRIIFGLDYYKENKNCISWPVDLGLKMTLLSIHDWREILRSCGLKDIKYFQTNSNGDFPGTLVIYGSK